MRQVKRAYSNQPGVRIDNDTYYIFIIPGETKDASKKAFMPRKRQSGFVYTANLPNNSTTEYWATVIAHELGHGAFRLEHHAGANKTTDNLMDYRMGRFLHQYQWNFIHNPVPMIALFQDDEEGAYGGIDENSEAFIARITSIKGILESERGDEYFQFIEKIKEIYEFFIKCKEQNWKGYEENSIVPKCIWENSDYGMFPYVSGIVDASYEEYEAFQELGDVIQEISRDLTNVIYSYSYAYFKCQPEQIELKKDEYKYLMTQLELTRLENKYIRWIKERLIDYEKESKAIERYFENCGEALEVKDKVDEVYELVTDIYEIIDFIVVVYEKLEDYYNTLENGDAVSWYERGKLTLQVGSLFVGVGTFSKSTKAKTVVKGLKETAERGNWSRFIDEFGKVVKGADLTKFTKVDNWLKGITNSTSKANIENIIKNWSDDLLSKLDNVPSRNPNFLSQVETNPSILNHFEEGSKIISNKATNLKAVELDMYALDKARPIDKAVVTPGTNSYKINTTRKSFDNMPNSSKMEINPQSGKIRDANGNVISTDNVNGEGLMYVIDDSGNIWIGGRGGEISYPHPTLVGGVNPNVKCAGMIKFKDGRILEISNNSGHFKPSNSVLQEAETIFKQKLPANSFDSQFKIVSF